MRINLRNINLKAYHGVYEIEKKEGNDFVVNISFDADLNRASMSDNLKDTINYERIYAIVRDDMSLVSDLLENVVSRIADNILLEFPQIKLLRVSLSKPNPFRDGVVEAVEVVEERKNIGNASIAIL